MSFQYDVAIIGAGPGGYVAAIRAAQLGGKVACIEREYIGGTCLNWGCIPTKAMVAGVERYHQIKNSKNFGITVGDVTIDFNGLMAHKDKVVKTLRGGIAGLFKKNSIDSIAGNATLVTPNTIKVTRADGSTETITAKNIILATGSEPVRLPVPGLDGEGIWTSNEAVNAPFVPKRLLVMGAGAIGCEFAYVFNNLGSKVTVVELMPQILPLEDAEIAAELNKSLKRQGITLMNDAKVKEVKHQADGSKQVVIETAKGDQIVECDIVLVGVGRRAVLEGLGIEGLGIRTHKRGIEVNEKMETNVPGIYAIGDVIGKIQLAHVASAEGIVAASNALGHNETMKYKVVPSCVYTVPEVASVGLTEAQAIAEGHDVKVGKFSLRGLGKMMAMGETEGLVKVVADAQYGEVLGVHIMGPHATDMIGEPTTAMSLEATLEDMVRVIHAHPTVTEGLLEGFEDALGHAIHK